MRPTPEQLEAAEAAIRDVPFHERCQTAWNVIAPLVLEAAAKVAEEPTEQQYPLDVRRVVAARIRALKDAK